jgi:hypothetical protein
MVPSSIDVPINPVTQFDADAEKYQRYITYEDIPTPVKKHPPRRLILAQALHRPKTTISPTFSFISSKTVTERD